MIVNLEGLDINVEVSGEDNEESVLLIHGFPDSTKLWREVAPKLVSEGYQVIAFDLPGFGESAIPDDVKASRLDNISNIIVGLLKHLEVEETHVIGHDWGSVVSWYFTYNHPEYVKSFTALSVGHPKAFLNSGFSQLLSSWYVILILNEELAENLFTANGWSLFRNFFVADECETNWIPDLSRDGRLTAGFNIYRANLNPDYNDDIMKSVDEITRPVLAIAGDSDPSLTTEQVDTSKEYVKNDFDDITIEDAEHWLPLYQVDEIVPPILDFLKKHS
ncbi:alpha/beta fold hydrolase [Staphylococcus auricularis]|uniref:Alpha/beta hydrolase n=1 Tax=Staphylococcus auricularis TaxID=29379 RepID=A0ABX5IFU9_9STAP|nr:alpha/beta hydrolase [Staphylococcus auricularis]MEB6570655.1 alpha/beta hydrolase [Staphylococcus auricularis]PTH18909.1 alpha/beta hydrolase [Staphylococcus auricularis]PTH24619.1 alpha/beta hydrolase [Staphylococcus auricularis]